MATSKTFGISALLACAVLLDAGVVLAQPAAAPRLEDSGVVKNRCMIVTKGWQECIDGKVNLCNYVITDRATCHKEKRCWMKGSMSPHSENCSSIEMDRKNPRRKL
jgi:hypothetical protein